MQETQNRFTNNQIINALPEEDYNRLLPNLEPVELSHGEIIYREGDKITHVYFLSDAMVSIISSTAEGHSVEVGVIGREGIAGIDVFLGVDNSYNVGLIQLPGEGLRIKTEFIREEFKRAGAFHDLTLRFLHALMFQISQTAVCNKLHMMEARLARWLLLCHDRSCTDKLPLTQDFLSIMLGVNRPSVTLAAVHLQSAGFINYKRGMITVTDREGLEDFTCDCYQRVKEDYDRLPR
jgi:CRP-like cAMP-binding protein